MNEIISLCSDRSFESLTSREQKILKKNNISLEKWNSFIELSNDLDLNDIGRKILLDEMIAGHVSLSCSQ